MEKETRHNFISLFLVQDRGGTGFISLITTNVHVGGLRLPKVLKNMI
jgi:hypothetical protein